MIRYDVRSPRADDFINHQEILDTLAYAAMHRHDAALAGNAEFGGKIAADVGDDLYLCRLCLHVHGLSSCVFANL